MSAACTMMVALWLLAAYWVSSVSQHVRPQRSSQAPSTQLGRPLAFQNFAFNAGPEKPQVGCTPNDVPMTPFTSNEQPETLEPLTERARRNRHLLMTRVVSHFLRSFTHGSDDEPLPSLAVLGLSRRIYQTSTTLCRLLL